MTNSKNPNAIYFERVSSELELHMRRLTVGVHFAIAGPPGVGSAGLRCNGFRSRDDKTVPASDRYVRAMAINTELWIEALGRLGGPQK